MCVVFLFSIFRHFPKNWPLISLQKMPYSVQIDLKRRSEKPLLRKVSMSRFSHSVPSPIRSDRLFSLIQALNTGSAKNHT